MARAESGQTGRLRGGEGKLIGKLRQAGFVTGRISCPKSVTGQVSILVSASTEEVEGVGNARC